MATEVTQETLRAVQEIWLWDDPGQVEAVRVEYAIGHDADHAWVTRVYSVAATPRLLQGPHAVQQAHLAQRAAPSRLTEPEWTQICQGATYGWQVLIEQEFCEGGAHVRQVLIVISLSFCAC